MAKHTASRALGLALLWLALLAASWPGAALSAQAEATSPPAEAANADATEAEQADATTIDRDIAVDLSRQLHEREGLEQVTVSVRDGVAVLDGTVVSLEDREVAEQVASQHADITQVDNRVVPSTRLSDRLRYAWGLVIGKVVRLVAAIPLLLVAVVVVALSWRLGSALGERIGKRTWRSQNPYAASLARRLTHWAVTLVGLLIALDLLGATALVGAVLGSAGVAGLVLGFAFKDIAENYVAGLLLSLRRPFAPGEAVRIDSYEGKVAALTSRSTILITYDGIRVSLPNALVFKSVVFNLNRNPKRRFDFTIPIDVSQSIRRAQQLALEAIAGIDGVLDDPAPSWSVGAYDDGAVRLQFFGWIDQTESDLGKVRSEALNAVRARFAEAAIEPPRSIQYIARLPGGTAAETPAPMDDELAAADTSVNRDIDEHVEAERQAQAQDDLIGGESAAESG